MVDLNPELAHRRRSGLARNITLWGAFLFGIHCISLSSSGLIPFSWVASVWPGASIVGVLLISILLCAVHGTAYAAMGATVPRAGADYVLASRVLSPALGFVASWVLVVFSGVVAGGLAAWVPKSVVPAFSRSVALIAHRPELNLVADFAASSIGTFVIAAALIVAVTASVVRTTRFVTTTLSIGFWLGAGAWAIILFSLLQADGPDAFRSAWNTFMGSSGPYGSFDQRVSLARAAGMVVDASTARMTLAGLIMGFWIFYGYYIPTFFSEEVRNPGRNLAVASIASIVVSGAIFIAAAMILGRLVPPEWIAAEGYIANNADAVKRASGGTDVIAMPWITFYAAILFPNFFAILFVAFAWIYTLANLIQTYLFYSSRLVYSWALDRILPDAILGKSVAEPEPSRAIVLIGSLALIGAYDGAFGGPLGTQLTFVFFAVVTQIVPVTALTLMPWLAPDLAKRVPNWLQFRVAGIPGVTLLGAITLSYLIWMVAASFLYPAAGVASPMKTVAWLVLFIVSGIVVFHAMRHYRLRREGIDIRDTYRGIGEDGEGQPKFD